VLGVHGNRIHGWVAQLGKAAAPVEVEMIVDGARSVVRADRDFAPFAQLPPEARNSGFVIDLPAGAPRRKGPTAWRVGVADSALLLGEGRAMPRATVLGALGLDGQIDPGEDDARTIGGWILDRRDPARACEVALFVDDAFLARVRTGNDGRFSVALPDALCDGPRHALAVVLSDNGLALPGGSLTIEHGRIVRAKGGILGVFGR